LRSIPRWPLFTSGSWNFATGHLRNHLWNVSKEGKRLLAISRIALKRIYYLSYAYRMTGERKYALRAEQEMLAVSRFTDWNPTHFLDVGEMVMALAIGL